MRYEAWILTEAVLNGEIDRVEAQVDNRVACHDGNFDFGMGTRKTGQSLRPVSSRRMTVSW
jgi:hypothetical protein